MKAETYLADPCGSSSLPFWKTEQTVLPPGMAVIRDDEYDPAQRRGEDEPYFRLIHRLEGIRRPILPAGFGMAPCDAEGFARHICECYAEEGISAEELRACEQRSVYDPELRIAVADLGNGRICATGIAETDLRIGEGVLEWIQVSPEYRRRGLGRFLVNELLYRMKEKVRFVTVSGKMNNPDNPFALYRACGFTNPVVWHVIR